MVLKRIRDRLTKKKITPPITENKLTWKIGGEAGYGIMTTGTIFSRSCSRGGLHVFDYPIYPSLIRGGHNTCHVRVEDRNIFSHIEHVDLLVALNKETIEQHKNEISPNGGIIYDGEKLPLDTSKFANIRLYNIPLLRLAKKSGGEDVMMNNVALGASVAVLDYNLNILLSVIKDTFKKKGKGVIDLNVKSAASGYNYIKEKYSNDFPFRLKPIKAKKRMLLTGNEALALGAIRAGCKFYAAYPMTPSTSILHYLKSKEDETKMIIMQMEDEISVINSVIGASFAGVRAMCATSGGGFSLMAEALGLAGMTETPVVIALAQRPGPSTGLPTHTEQADLRFALHASQGDFPRVVIAPGDVTQAYYETIRAFNIAEKYQLPVIILTDKHLSESHKTVEPFSDKGVKIGQGDCLSERDLKRIRQYKRYLLTKSGMSPRVIPGQKGGVFRATGDEHDETGLLTEDPILRVKMMQKRMRKLERIKNELKNPGLIGLKHANVTLIGWGSTKGSILEAMKMSYQNGIKVNFLQILYLSPFPADLVTDVMKTAEKTVLVESNYSAQLGGVIKEHTGYDVDYKILKYDGRPFSPEEIRKEVKQIIG